MYDSHDGGDGNVVKTSRTLVFSGTSPSHKDDRDEVLEFASSNNKETFPCYDKHIIAVFTLHYNSLLCGREWIKKDY